MKGFVEAVKGEDDVGFGFVEPIVTRTEIFRPMPGGNFIAGSGQMTTKNRSDLTSAAGNDNLHDKLQVFDQVSLCLG